MVAPRPRPMPPLGGGAPCDSPDMPRGGILLVMGAGTMGLGADEAVFAPPYVGIAEGVGLGGMAWPIIGRGAAPLLYIGVKAAAAPELVPVVGPPRRAAAKSRDKVPL